MCERVTRALDGWRAVIPAHSPTTTERATDSNGRGGVARAEAGHGGRTVPGTTGPIGLSADGTSGAGRGKNTLEDPSPRGPLRRRPPLSPAPSPAIRLMLVDDHPVLRVGLASVLAANHGFEIVGEAEDGEATLRLYGTLRPALAPRGGGAGPRAPGILERRDRRAARHLGTHGTGARVGDPRRTRRRRRRGPRLPRHSAAAVSPPSTVPKARHVAMSMSVAMKRTEASMNRVPTPPGWWLRAVTAA
mgnify:CR=1 FL=1